jgi:hypothetical protein
MNEHTEVFIMYTLICAVYSFSYHTATGLTILGPLFFLSYINNLPYKINNISKPVLFANNTSIIFSDSPDYATELIVTFDTINIWFTINSSSLNLNKTNYIQFTAKTNTKIHICINFEDIHINNIYNIKFPGLTIETPYHGRKNQTTNLVR